MSPSIRIGTSFTVNESSNFLWTPDQLGSDLALWLDAQDESTITKSDVDSDGTDEVEVWADKSGNERDAAIDAEAERPEYRTSSPTAIYGDGVDDWLTLGDPSVDLSGSLTVSFWVKTSLTSRSNPFDKAYGAEFSFILEDGSTSASKRTLSTYFGNAGGDAKPFAWNTWKDAIFVGEWTHFIWVRDVPNQTVTLHRNGASFSGNKNRTEWETPSESSDPIEILNGYDDYLEGGIEQVNLITKALSQEEIDKLAGHDHHLLGLESKLPSDHPYKNSPPLA